MFEKKKTIKRVSDKMYKRKNKNFTFDARLISAQISLIVAIVLILIDFELFPIEFVMIPLYFIILYLMENLRLKYLILNRHN